jgi:bifunctional DNA-binding transcriptional regulator/antitoxin component of YhaV-PrlF toxin-antitoxin module
MTYIKTVKVTNPKNVIVQLPRYIVDKWGLKQGDSIEVFTNEKEETITIKPRGRYVNIRSGSNINKEG